MTFGTAWAADTQENSIKIGFKLIHNYTISYDLAGGTVSEDNPTSYDVTTATFTLKNPTRTGYTFAGWTGTSVDDTMSKDVTISTGSTGNREYTANWTLSVYVLSYDLDGGTVSPDNPTSYTIESENFTLMNPTSLQAGAERVLT